MIFAPRSYTYTEIGWFVDEKTVNFTYVRTYQEERVHDGTRSKAVKIDKRRETPGVFFFFHIRVRVDN